MEGQLLVLTCSKDNMANICSGIKMSSPTLNTPSTGSGGGLAGERANEQQGLRIHSGFRIILGIYPGKE